MRALVSVSGQGLVRPGHPLDVPVERANLHRASAALAELAGRHELVVTCGDGPHLDLLLSGGTSSPEAAQFDVIRAESAGAVGYLLAQELRNALPDRGVAWLLTQVRVDPNDQAFRVPDAAVGPVVDGDLAQTLSVRFHWRFRRQGEGWRRVLPAPQPLGVIEAPTIDRLASAGVVVVCAAAGVPVVADYTGAFRGVAAVASPERSTAVLAKEIGADRLVFLVDTPDRLDTSRLGLRVINADEMTPADAAVGTDSASIDAARYFVAATGKEAAVGPLREARAVVDGDVGLTIRLTAARAAS